MGCRVESLLVWPILAFEVEVAETTSIGAMMVENVEVGGMMRSISSSIKSRFSCGGVVVSILGGVVPFVGALFSIPCSPCHNSVDFTTNIPSSAANITTAVAVAMYTCALAEIITAAQAQHVNMVDIGRILRK